MADQTDRYHRSLQFLSGAGNLRLFVYGVALFLHLLLLFTMVSRNIPDLRLYLPLHWPAALLIAAFLGTGHGLFTAFFFGAITPLFFWWNGTPTVDEQWLQLQLASTAALALFVFPFGKLRALTLEQARLSQALQTFAQIDPATELINSDGFRMIGKSEFKKATRISDDISFYLRNDEVTIGREDNSAHKKTREIKDYLGTLCCAVVAPHNHQQLRKRYGTAGLNKLMLQFAQRLSAKEQQRESDLIARGSGAELLFLMPSTSSRNSVAPIQKLVAQLSQSAFRLGAKSQLLLFDVGVAELSEHDIALEDILDRAIRALRTAQEGNGGEILLGADTGAFHHLGTVLENRS